MKEDYDASLKPRWRNLLTTHARELYDISKETPHTSSSFREQLGSISASLNNAEFLGSGVGRVVFTLPNESHSGNSEYVIKIAVQPSMVHSEQEKGINQNQNEVDTWYTVKDTSEEKLFFPVTDHSHNYHWIIMPRGYPVNDDITGWISDIESDVEEFISLDELAVNNILSLDGELRVSDYGIPNMRHSNQRI